MQQWEYMRMRIGRIHTPSGETETFAEEAGREGWELIQVIRDPADRELYFRRPVDG